MDLLDLKVKIGVDDEASDKISGISDKLKSGLSAAAKATAAIMTAATTAAAVGTVKIGKAALESYASYEQLAGGVDKLFGSVDGLADQVKSNAQKAYKSAGMSANEYMETVTGFSASLMQSLGDDTWQAADYADQAIRDMSDNANTFGTDIEAIQNAYQGFAKGNFTMLDNLKLGYGGTKEEMERLLRHAEELEGYTEGSLSADNFADIVTAIHAVQEEQGIAGTTAKEAAKTIEGSINTTKAAWQNLLTEFAKDEGDVGARMSELMESAMTVFDNVMPRLQIIFQSIADALPTYMPMILDVLVNQVFPMLMETVNSVLPMLLEALVQVIVMIAEQIPSLVETLVPVIIGMAPKLLEAGLKMFLGIWQALAKSGPTLINQLVDVILEMVEMLVDYAPEFLEAMFTVMEALLNAIIERAPEILTKLGELLVRLVQGVAEKAPDMLMRAAELISKIPEAIGKALPDVIRGIGDLIMGAIRHIPDFINDMWNAGVDLVQGLIDGIANSIGGVLDAILGGLQDAVNGALEFLGIASPSKLFSWMGDMSMEGMAEGIEDTAQKAEDAMRKAAEGIYGAADGQINVGYDTESGMAVGQGRMVTVNIDTLAVREEADIDRIAELLAQKVARDTGGTLWNQSLSVA